MLVNIGCFAVAGLPSSMQLGEAVSLLMLSDEDIGGDWDKGSLSKFTVATEKSKADVTSFCTQLTRSLLNALVGGVCWPLGEEGLQGEGTELGGVGGNDATISSADELSFSSGKTVPDFSGWCSAPIANNKNLSLTCHGTYTQKHKMSWFAFYDTYLSLQLRQYRR